MTEAPTRSFPTLAESRRLRLVAFAALYVAQGIGVGPLLYALPPYFAQNGLTQATIGAYIGAVFLPWSLKLVAGPLMDRWSFLPMGRRRPWVLASQLGIVLSFLAVALVPEPLEKLSWLIAGCFMANVFIAFQDVAIDGMAVDILPHAEQGPANGLMFGGQALGIAGATAVSAWVLSASGPATMFFLLAGMFAVAMLVPLVARERPGERLLPWSPGGASATAMQLQLHGWTEIGHRLFRVIALPGSLVAAAAIYSYRIGYGVITAFVPVMAVQQLGWSDTAYSELRATAELAAALIGMSLGGVVAYRFGAVRVVKAGGAIVIAILLAMASREPLWALRGTLTGFVIIYAVSVVMFSILFATITMSICSRRVAATQFGLYMAISNLGMSTGSALLGALSVWFSYPQLFVVVAACYALMLLLIRFLNVPRHLERLDRVDSKEEKDARVPAQPALS